MSAERPAAIERHPAESASRLALIRVAIAAEAYRDHEESEPNLGPTHIEWESQLYQRQAALDAALREGLSRV